jgi:rhamnopyranosyl-N-acetylglucosaminyl-diphospho-decaprenol beta-1,3/1,4-galactofuranosyltransferase
VLPRQMEALHKQTHPLEEIIVVDNASTDGTAEMLAERFPRVTILRMPENVGAGGALEAGVGYAALQKRHDWVWMFDDDSVPDAEALQSLLGRTESTGGDDGWLGMVAPLPVHRETGTTYPPLLWRDGYVRPSPELLRQPVWFADLVIVSGCLVRREVVENIGLPRADFFMDFIDFEYCLRARFHGYTIAVVARSEFAHEIGTPRKIRLPGYSRLWADQPPWREYYIGRNLTYTVWWHYPRRRTKWFVVAYLARRAGGVLLFSSNKFACLKKMAQGFSDGRHAILGIRFLPD